VPARLFTLNSGLASPYPCWPTGAFAVGQYLEALDPERQALICVVSVAEVKGESAHLLTVPLFSI